ncbi:aldehyde dehydrogenase family protein, partial [Salipiger sp. HF18]|uniref:aldehyde dehydrogenase family protein n=1 Tax=Salipiger sp. HF18 TaxID=2721557 RepID=UPI00142DE892
CLYLQEDIAPHVTEMLIGAMEALTLGQPWDLATDVGPVIDAEAREAIATYVAAARAEGRVIAEREVPAEGHFIGPAILKVNGIAEMEREIFGPVLHLAIFKADELDSVIDAINETGYGLTFGLQTRIDDRVQYVTERVEAGNIYVNRNQIGAIVGSQPFGGEGLSGTGPKAGGPLYCDRFRRHAHAGPVGNWSTRDIPERLTSALYAAGHAPAPTTAELPGPTGEANQYTSFARPPVLCLGPGSDCAAAQAEAIRKLGGVAVVSHGKVPPEALAEVEGFSAAIWWGDEANGRAYRQALARRDGPILTLVTGKPDRGHARAERHVCIDTTASGGNAALLGGNM